MCAWLLADLFWVCAHCGLPYESQMRLGPCVRGRSAVVFQSGFCKGLTGRAMAVGSGGPYAYHVAYKTWIMDVCNQLQVHACILAGWLGSLPVTTALQSRLCCACFAFPWSRPDVRDLLAWHWTSCNGAVQDMMSMVCLPVVVS